MKSKKLELVLVVTLLALFSFLSEAKVTSSGSKLTGKLNINIATVEDLALLPGIGKEKALDILKLRGQIKFFRRLDDLLKVKGIGKKLFGKIEPYIKLDGKSDLSLLESHKK